MELAPYARYKRVAEWYAIDPAFRNLLERDPAEALARLGADFSALDPQVAREGARGVALGRYQEEPYRSNPYVAAAGALNARVSGYVEQVHGRAGFSSERLFRFADTQRNRCRMESSAIRAHANIRYFPLAFELSDGCRVQCPFCGLDAPAHRADFPHDESGARLWRDVLAACVRVVGPITAACSCYFATEPFDNPDYELFLRDFYEVAGGLPQTTTAVADRCPERVRSLMRMYGPTRLRTQNPLRLSVRTLGQYRRIAEAFSPEELAFVEIVANNPESLNRYAASGRVRGGGFEAQKELAYSLCCVAGAVVNMTRRTVSFIEPEIPDGRFPTGLRVRTVRTFNDGPSFEQALRELFDAYGHGLMPRDLPLALNPHAQVRFEGGTVVFAGDGVCHRVSDGLLIRSALRALGAEAESGIDKNIGAGDRTDKSSQSFDAILQATCAFGATADELYQRMNALFVRGYLRLR